MNETDRIELDLKDWAKKISGEYKGAPVVVVMGGTGEMTKKGKLNRVMTGSWCEKSRFYHFAGILQTSIVYTATKHCPWLIDGALALHAEALNKRGKYLNHHSGD